MYMYIDDWYVVYYIKCIIRSYVQVRYVMYAPHVFQVCIFEVCKPNKVSTVKRTALALFDLSRNASNPYYDTWCFVGMCNYTPLRWAK